MMTIQIDFEAMHKLLEETDEDTFQYVGGEISDLLAKWNPNYAAAMQAKAEERRRQLDLEIEAAASFAREHAGQIMYRFDLMNEELAQALIIRGSHGTGVLVDTVTDGESPTRDRMVVNIPELHPRPAGMIDISKRINGRTGWVGTPAAVEKMVLAHRREHPWRKPFLTEQKR